MQPKKKLGFKTFVNKTIPLSHSSLPPQAGLLPNGFRIGEKVYYVDYANSKVFGKVIDYYQDYQQGDRKRYVWGYWEGNSEGPGYMPTNRVFHTNGEPF